MLPRRFRTRVFAGVGLVATCLLVSACYVSDGGLLSKNVRREGRLWTLLWSAPEREECRPDVGRWRTADVYPTLPFEVPDDGSTGLWSDALEGRYREARLNKWKDLPLKVIVVPHSHVDPGWLRTFEDYHLSFVTQILDNMVNFLNRTEDFTFVWSEISFFAKWWKKQNENTQSTVKKILQRKQLEFVTGGWVMPDEAVTSYYAALDQLVEGHQWLQYHLDVSPRHGWSVDVFGHSASYPYILSAAGISQVVIMRTHYAWKKFLAGTQSLDFFWEQSFPSRRVLCHLAPSDLYSFKYACGPDPEICLKFDFRHVEREYSESTADRITEENVGQRAGYLLSQYGRFASLYPHNVLLVPLGDDFRYNVAAEWVQQYENYKKLFGYINSRREWNAQVQFGTVSDYFREVEHRMRTSNGTLQSIEGDFFPYADTYANFRPSYWTGFYSTRPFYKKLSHELEYWLRTAEILYSLSKTLISGAGRGILSRDYSFLVSARRTLALFQHHDAVTGTSKEATMRDYGRKLHTGIMDAMSVVSHATQLLLMERPQEDRTWTSQVYPNVYRSGFDPLIHRPLSVLDGGRKIILFNSLTVERTEIVRLKISYPLVKVVDSDSKDVPFQINPVFKGELTASNTMFELLFLASLRPLTYRVYTVLKNEEREHRNRVPKTVVSISMNNDELDTPTSAAFTFEKPSSRDIVFESRKVSVGFSPRGHLKSIYVKESGLSKSLDIDFLTYHSWMYRSGAYLFNPDTKAIPVRNKTDRFPLLAVIRGPLMSELTTVYHDFLKFSVRLYKCGNCPAGLQLEVHSDLSKMTSEDIELIMRIRSDMKNSDGTFYADSNGFQMMKRPYVPELEIQGNYYPATTALFIEDEEARLNVLLPHSHGVTGGEGGGVMEVMLDRKIRYDDGRGVGEGVTDSGPLSNVFWLFLEPRSSYHDVQLSAESFWLSLFLLHPPVTLVSEYSEMKRVKSDLSFLDSPWPADVHLVNLRTLQLREDEASNASLMIVHQRPGFCSWQNPSFVDSFLRSERHAFSLVKVKSVTRTSLTGTLPAWKEEGTSPLGTCKVEFD